MQAVYIDEKWVIDKYLSMEKAKSWGDLDSKHDLQVLELERELLAEQLGVTVSAMPPITTEELVVTIDNEDDWLTTYDRRNVCSLWKWSVWIIW